MKATVRRLAAGVAVGAIIAGAAFGNGSPVHANGFGDGVLAPPARVAAPDPPQTGLADLTIAVYGWSVRGTPDIRISNIGTRDATAFPVQEYAADGQYYATEIPGLAAGASIPFPDNLAPADCGSLVTVMVDSPKSLREVTYGNNELRFSPDCLFNPSIGAAIGG